VARNHTYNVMETHGNDKHTTPTPDRKKRILIADDDQDLLVLLCRFLQRRGYEVLGLPDATTIVDGLYEVPDLFILDKQMGMFDGLVVCDYLRHQENARHTPIVMISGSDSKAQAQAAGVDYYLEKPLDMNKFLHVVEQYINRAA
jgi:DNA-binding response OmpR family regulator